MSGALPREQKPRAARFDPDKFDGAKFEPLIAEALQAFRTDVSYAVEMANTAHNILLKRAIWAARMRIREAEASARSECEASGPAICPVLGGEPCGGSADCPYSPPDLRGLPISVSYGTTTDVRVRPGLDGHHATYLRDSITRSLAAVARG